MDLFSKLYSIDIDLREQNLSPDEFLRKRRSLSIPIWKDFRKWLVKIKHQTSGTGSELEKAMNYSLNQYRILVRYLKYAEISPDNNIAENAIRPFVVGRKNWLFNTPKGAHSSAALYSLVETAKANNVEQINILTTCLLRYQN